jgi:hypothetical protein
MPLAMDGAFETAELPPLLPRLLVPLRQRWWLMPAGLRCCWCWC